MILEAESLVGRRISPLVVHATIGCHS